MLNNLLDMEYIIVVESSWSPCVIFDDQISLNGAQLVLPAGALSEDVVYRFTVDVAVVDGRTSADSVFVFPVRLPVLQVWFAAKRISLGST